ncbi:MAG: nascent polypeptide-associated complex protein [Thermoplasmata archaeon]
MEASGEAMFPGGRGMNPRQLQMMMKRMGVTMEELDDVEEVVIRCSSRDIVIKKPSVAQITAQGQKYYQVSGEATTVERAGAVQAEDVRLVVNQTGASEEEARRALQEAGGRPAEAIMKLLEKKGV